jgi:hypothetical protein
MVRFVDTEIDDIFHLHLVFYLVCHHEACISGADAHEAQLARRVDGLFKDRNPV